MSDVRTEARDNVLLLTIERPHAFNALTAEVIEALRREVVAAAEHPDFLAVVITGAGTKAFCAGADLKELDGRGADEALEILGFGQKAFREIEMAEIPVITAVNGVALGGGFELVLASDVPVLAMNAQLGLPESSLGLIPGYGGTQRLPRVVGEAVATHLMLTGTRLKAERAYALGITPVAPVDEGMALDAAMGIAEKICSQGPEAVKTILRSMDRGRGVALDAGLQIETGLAALAVAGQESTEGISAFLDKRPARFGAVSHTRHDGES